MSSQESDRFARYLAAKTSVDDRARNARVWEAMTAAFRGPASGARTESPLEVLEVGAGIGTMIERLVSHDVLSDAVYTAVDLSRERLATARERLPVALATHGWRTADPDLDPELDPDRGPRSGSERLRFERDGQGLEVVLVPSDATAWLRMRDAGSLDVVIAHAVLDELDAEVFLPLMRSRLRPGGIAYASLCFDGLTAVEPEIERALDARIEERYHATMDARLRAGAPSGDSRSGRHLFSRLRRFGFELLAAGGSDWVVAAGPGGYEGDEAFFLEYLVDGVQRALSADPAFAPGEVEAWTAARHAQIERGELVWIAHNLDLLAGIPDA